MKIIESIINMKLNGIQRDELLSLAHQYRVTLTPEEADQVCRLLRGKNYNLFNVGQRRMVVQQIAEVVGRDRAEQIEQLFLSFTGR
ncbi:DUF2624 family protein [Bacillus testis]|uniref:DUF2624 family protein n=1 Tax=Bacillus testis TaxID=1622072 RepID=UPI00067EA130|nr:DUF2624 family protein [Bacillus testis]